MTFPFLFITLNSYRFLLQTSNERRQMTRIGIAQTDITPKKPAWLTGYGNRDHKSEGVYQALRAGALEPYSILLPPEFKEAPVSNARSGNYCQPRCDEATTEVQFVDSNAGSLQVSLLYHNKSFSLHGQFVC